MNTRIALCVFCVLFLASCASTQIDKAAPLVSEFGDDVYSLTNTTNEMMELLAENVTQAQVMNYAVKEGDEWNKISFDDLRSINGTIGDSLKRLYATSALKSLGRYAKSLSDLATYNTVESINRSTVELHSSLVSARDTYQTISAREVSNLDDENLSLIATAANALGKAYSEQIKIKEMRDIVVTTDPAVQEITQGIATTFDDGGAFADIFQVTGGVVLSERFREEKRAYQNKSLEQKIAFLDNYRVLLVTIDNSPEILVTIKSTAEMVGKAHSNLSKMLSESNVTLAEVQTAFSELKAEKERLEEFRKSLLRNPAMEEGNNDT